MDPSFWSSAFQAGASVLKAGVTEAPAPPQRADGYAMGGMLDGRSPNTLGSGAVGGAYGGAFSQANIDGSNWIVATGKSSAWADSLKSGNNGGLSPSLSSNQGGVAPPSVLNPFGQSSMPFDGLPTALGNPMVLIVVAAIAYFIARK